MNDSMIGQAVSAIRQGGVVAHPTDTCYGLAVDIHNENAVDKLYALKGMDRSKPTSILVRSLDEALKYGVFSGRALELARKYWPGALTLVVPRTLKLPDFFNPGHTTVGIRCIAEPLTVAMLERFGGAVTTTSANFHGKPSPYSVDEISVNPNVVLDGGLLDRDNLPSTIVKVEGGELTMIRQGSLML